MAVASRIVVRVGTRRESRGCRVKRQRSKVRCARGLRPLSAEPRPGQSGAVRTQTSDCPTRGSGMTDLGSFMSGRAACFA